MTVVFGLLTAIVVVYWREKVKENNVRKKVYARILAHLNYWRKWIRTNDSFKELYDLSEKVSIHFDFVDDTRNLKYAEMWKKIQEEHLNKMSFQEDLSLETIKEVSKDEYEHVLDELNKLRSGIENGQYFIPLNEISSIELTIQSQIIELHHTLIFAIAQIKDMLVVFKFDKKKTQKELDHTFSFLLVNVFRSVLMIESLRKKCQLKIGRN